MVNFFSPHIQYKWEVVGIDENSSCYSKMLNESTTCWPRSEWNLKVNDKASGGQSQTEYWFWSTLKSSILLRWIKQLWHNGEVEEKLNNSLECECCLDEYYLCTYKDIFLWHWSTMRLEIHADFYLVSCWGVALRSRWLVRHSDFGSLLWLRKDIG